MKMEENEETSVISLRVNSEQKEAIIQFFNFNDWDLNEVNQEDADSNIEETEFERTFRISQNENCEECQHCLCRPCITDENNRQMWWLSEPVRANERNRVLRKEKYKLFWTMLFHRGVFMDTRYKSRKTVIAGRSQTKRCCMPSQRYFATVCFKTCAILVSQSEKYSIHGTSLEVKSLIAELLIFIRYYYLFIFLQKKRISIQKLCHRAVTAIMCGLVSSLRGHTTR